MAKNLIYLCKRRIAGIDTILPVLMEVKKVNPSLMPIIVFFDQGQHDNIRKNYNIWEGIQSLDSRIWVIRHKNKFITAARLIKFISALSFKQNVVIREGDVLPLHNLTMSLLKKLSKVTEIKAYLPIPFADYIKNLNTQLIMHLEKQENPKEVKFLSGKYDYFLSVLNAEELKEACNAVIPENKIIKVGYVYKLPEWEKSRKEAVAKNKIIHDAYFFYILHATYKRRPFEPAELIELIEESLWIMKKYNNKIKTVFKPHSITDLGKTKEILDKVGYSNYVIDYGHPMVLSSNAKFVFGNAFSSIMFMAYYLGKPTVEYAQYDPELLEKIGEQSLGGKFCDFFINRDKEKLDEILDKLINGDGVVTRNPDAMRKNFPDTPPEFYEFWHKTLS